MNALARVVELGAKKKKELGAQKGPTIFDLPRIMIIFKTIKLCL